MKRPRNSTETVWRERRKAGLANDHWPDCPYCETPFFYTEGELDHIEARSVGGSNELNNLILVCKKCNRSKTNIQLHMWLYLNHISLESVYRRLKEQDKTVPKAMLDVLGYES